jgi:hypothetical protein
LFEHYPRSERALVAALAEMFVQGVSTRKVKAITEELCGHSFSAASISAINQRLDEAVAQFAERFLAEAFPYLILDARFNPPALARANSRVIDVKAHRIAQGRWHSICCAFAPESTAFL